MDVMEKKKAKKKKKSPTTWSNDIPALQKKHLPSPICLFPLISGTLALYLKKQKSKQTKVDWRILNTRHRPFAPNPRNKPSYAGFYELPLQSPPSLSLNMPFFKNDF